MDTKKSLMVLVVAVLLAVGGYAFLDKQAGKAPEKNGNGSQEEVSQSAQPKFVLGSVTKVEASKITFTADGQKTAMVSSSTQIEKQVKSKDGVSLAAAALADVKAGSRIAIFYSEEPVAGTYQATKIQVLN